MIISSIFKLIRLVLLTNCTAQSVLLPLLYGALGRRGVAGSRGEQLRVGHAAAELVGLLHESDHDRSELLVGLREPALLGLGAQEGGDLQVRRILKLNAQNWGFHIYEHNKVLF